ncbi:RNA polymerase sigma-70 factor [Compostibacter hankyongensis]|uniref:RNA polymerase sigma-70 factor n=1 Tax=Compostibacter hankyongensis TaxID=1007089 RepID=A0ABP8FJC9_9BACT
MKLLPDIVLLHQLKHRNSRAAFEELYQRYWQMIYDIACQKLRDKEAAKDVVQDIFVMLWSRRHELTIRANFSGYLYTVLKNKFIDMERKQAVQRKVQAELLHTTGSFADDPVSDYLDGRELERHLHFRIQRMPEGMREVFLLSRQQQLSHQEIADHLSISVKTVKKQISNALKRLQLREYPL